MSTAADSTTQPSTQPFDSQYKTASYGIGYDLGRNIRESKVALDPEVDLRQIFEAEELGAEFTPELREQEERLRQQIERQQKAS